MGQSGSGGACGPLDGASSRWCFLSTPAGLILTTGAFVSPPAGSSFHRLVRLFTGWFFSPLADSFCFSPPAGSSLHHELQLEQCPVAWARCPSLFVLCQRSSACSCSQLRMRSECYAPYISINLDARPIALILSAAFFKKAKSAGLLPGFAGTPVSSHRALPGFAWLPKPR